MFGSVLGQDFGPESDVDVLITFAPSAEHSVLDIVRLQDELEAMFGRSVDTAERSAVERAPNYLRRRSILDSARTLYAA